jgi:succinate dehydrogenase hydrophobic anchor subunit
VRRQIFAWYYLRLTGLAMVGLVLVHLYLMHYASAPSQTTSGFVGARWGGAPAAGAGWRFFDWALLALALTHGVVGVHGMLRDSLRRRWAHAAVDAGAWAVALGFLAAGTSAAGAGPPPGGVGPLSGAAWIPGALVACLAAVATATYAGVAAVLAWFAVHLSRGRPVGRWSYPGQWAFALNRVAGAGVLGFLLLHILDVALVPFAPDLYDRTVAAYAMPYLVPMEAALVAAVLYHALDGLRLIVLEALDRRGEAAVVPSFVALVVTTVALWLPALAVLLGRRP